MTVTRRPLPGCPARHYQGTDLGTARFTLVADDHGTGTGQPSTEIFAFFHVPGQPEDDLIQAPGFDVPATSPVARLARKTAASPCRTRAAGDYLRARITTCPCTTAPACPLTDDITLLQAIEHATRTTTTPATPAAPAMSRQLLGTRLRQLREAHGLLLADATDHLGVAPSTLSRIETGRAPTRTSYLHVLLDLYQITDPDERRDLADLARHGQRDNWWTATTDILPPGADRCIGLEDAATSIRTYATHTIPDLLQASGYATAAARATRPGISADHARQIADLAARRQQILHRAGFKLRAVLDETTLVRPPGDPAVMASQLDHLTALAASPQTAIQVLPLTTAAPVLSPPFTLYVLTGLPDAACTSSHAGQHHTTTRHAITTTMNTAFTALAKAALTPDESAALIRHHADHPHGRT